MSQPGAVSRISLSVAWLVLGLAMIAVPVWLGWTRWPAVLSGHPAMLVAGIACGMAGFVAVAWSIATLAIGGRLDQEGDSDRPTRRTPEQVERRARRRIIAAIPALIICTLLVAALAYARPFVASPVAAAALMSANGVQISDRLSWYEMTPVKQDKTGKTIKPKTGLIFVPGARVDARAYAHVLRPLADAGYLVAVLKEPFGFSVVQPDHAQTVVDLHPEIAHWAVGGHSLGGVTAASFADSNEQINGLVLYGSYPAGPIERTDLKVLSISGSADGLTTPADIEASKANLPPTTTFVVIDGAAHSTLGDYGSQPGDGLGAGDRAAQQSEIAKATQAFLVSLTPAPPPKKKK
jgi:pimeloyl-ACP methyl ester carboxylesterase